MSVSTKAAPKAVKSNAVKGTSSSNGKPSTNGAPSANGTTANGTTANGSRQFQLSKARCNQCGRELKHVPFSLNNIICRECYGSDRKVRTLPNRWVPGQTDGTSGPRAAADMPALVGATDEADDLHADEDVDHPDEA